MANTTWKQVVLDTADSLRTALNTEEQIAVGEIPTKVSALEDVTPEVDTQEPLLDQLAEILASKGALEGQEKTVTPTMEAQVVEPDQDKMLTKVTVGGIAGTDEDVTDEVATYTNLLAQLDTALQGNKVLV